MILKYILRVWAALVALLTPALVWAQTSNTTDPAAAVVEMKGGGLLLVAAIIAAVVAIGLAVLGIKGLFTAFKAISKAMSSGAS